MSHASEKVLGMAFVSPDLVFPKPDQPRKYFDEEKLKLLAYSIKKGGQEHPAKVKVLQENGEGTTYQLIDGERRWRACAMIKERLWVVICSVGSDAEHFRSASVSNIASLQLAPLEIAHAVERVKREYNMTQAEVAETFCKSAGWAAQHLGLLRLAPAVQSQLSGAIPKNGRLPFDGVGAFLSPSNGLRVLLLNIESHNKCSFSSMMDICLHFLKVSRKKKKKFLRSLILLKRFKIFLNLFQLILKRKERHSTLREMF